ncbi:MAG TPA: hypothetical protein VE084_05125 [Burkholderiaceae bacterium]|nr:hypothetical protein [Burkholderiaceae bacterium]
MKTLTALLAGLACLLAACDDKPKPGGPVPKAEHVVPLTSA